jgi:hypothetical protein
MCEREETRCQLCVSVNEGRFTSLAAKLHSKSKRERISGAWLCANQHVHNKATGSQFRSWNSYHCCISLLLEEQAHPLPVSVSQILLHPSAPSFADAGTVHFPTGFRIYIRSRGMNLIDFTLL